MAIGSVARLLSALSAECGELAFRVEDMHRLLADAEGPGRAQSSDAIMAAQDIDFIWQHLSALSQFLMQVAEQTPAFVDLDIDGPLQSIRLSDLRDRLAGREAGGDPPVVRSGELELL